MIKILAFALIPLVFSSCDCGNIIVKGGHSYTWKPYSPGHYEHDPLCEECKKHD